MAKIPNSAVPTVYTISKEVFERKFSLKEGKEKIIATGVINPSSAADYIYNFRYLREGKPFSRNLNTYSMDYFIEHLFNDYGQAGLSNALRALEGHIAYHKERNTNLNSMVEILNKYRPKLHFNQDELEQITIIESFTQKNSSKADLVNYLKNLQPSDSELIEVNGKKFKRDNKTVAIIKEIRGHRCQICQTQIQKADGRFYVEAAHILSKSQKGPETPDNILILCPNHHKEFDLGKREIINHTKEAITFKLNGVIHQLSLTVE